MNTAAAELDVVTVNRGDHAAYAAIRRAIGNHAAAALQEMHSVPEILRLLERARLGVWPGNLPDSRSDPVVWDPQQIDVDDMESYPLLPAGRRADVANMAKSLNVIKGVHVASGRRVAIGSAHNIHEQWRRGRGAPARTFVENLLEAADPFTCATIIGADWNDKPTGKSLAPVRAHRDWDLDQLHRPVTTHGRGWSPDGFVFSDRDPDPGVLRYVDHHAIAVDGTDHKGLSARFLLSIKEHHR